MTELRHDWQLSEVLALYNSPFMRLIKLAHDTHCEYFDPQVMQLCMLCNIKTGACPEDCAYCPQSGRYNTGLKKEKLMPIEKVLARAKQAKALGATRFCVGAAWRSPPAKDLPKVLEMIREIKKLGLEICVTLGLLNENHAKQLKASGLDFYNHNIDSSPQFYQKIITTRTFQNRLDTLRHVRKAGIKVCCGGILGMGETREDRCEFLCQLANLPEHPESVPINHLIPITGTPLEKTLPLEPFEMIRTIAVARIMMPCSMIRLTAGRDQMNEQTQALCFFAGANSIFYGDILLTAKNSALQRDQQMLAKLNLIPQELSEHVASMA